MQLVKAEDVCGVCNIFEDQDELRILSRWGSGRCCTSTNEHSTAGFVQGVQQLVVPAVPFRV
jgi:hypothetical protein